MKRIFGTVRGLAVVAVGIYIASVGAALDRQFMPAALLFFIALTLWISYKAIASLEKRIEALEAEKKPPQ